ncbi:unnamed protein product [Ilex paraguariensis]|uniref:Uncharacterized protein n=1 Tax=Ilex paraguariensis TaxID=185542 RepID=A0ABC8UD27_9AQUA
MEDIEDLLVGSGGAPPGFRLPLAAPGVGVNPKQKKPVRDSLTSPYYSKIPGTQTIYMKTFGCSHNQKNARPKLS